jgi:hypothetical protein
MPNDWELPSGSLKNNPKNFLPFSPKSAKKDVLLKWIDSMSRIWKIQNNVAPSVEFRLNAEDLKELKKSLKIKNPVYSGTESTAGTHTFVAKVESYFKMNKFNDLAKILFVSS